MKNSKEYAKNVRNLYRSLKRKYAKVNKPIFEEPLDALIYAILSENNTASTARTAMKRFKHHFIDWNDLRVSHTEEIVELLGCDDKHNRAVAATLKNLLASIFNKYNIVSLGHLTEMGKRPAKQVLEKMDNVSRFAADYVMLTALNGHSIPLTARMIEYLRKNDLVHPQADEQDIESFLERQITASQGYEFYALLRRASESAGKTTRKAAASKKTKR